MPSRHQKRFNHAGQHTWRSVTRDAAMASGERPRIPDVHEQQADSPPSTPTVQQVWDYSNFLVPGHEGIWGPEDTQKRRVEFWALTTEL